MKLKELRNQWEKGREVLLALSTPNRDKVYALLYNPHSKSNLRTEYSVFEYSKNDNGWIIYVNPNYSEFEHLEEGLQYINSKFEQFLPE